ncbi:hypothetical protein K443DRAFT_678014 [Laccaria amethystina LaAM-08-1]|uniref:SET domain-containing protein n=1 Tax=Laccaria amethystina LaAM-08-1 TaxID=1095629 RepID=A0A0C9WSN4_9AGAR|nr:hypothetical protein K443DRAFT_678014 [Laccaria amethystina LaAM-08-1]
MLTGNDTLRLVPHPKARDQAISIKKLEAGSLILSTPSFASILLATQKGHRCDTCFRLPADGTSLRRCTGCGSYWYCDLDCQTEQWHAHHKRICKNYTKFTASLAFQSLRVHERNDSLLLSHLLAHLSLLSTPYAPEDSSPLSIFLSLLPSPVPDMSVPPVCPISPTPPLDLLRTLYTRFGNNNFAIHSHLTTIGHGVFPLASRLFNHSCVPNAAARYSLSPSHGLWMEVIAIRDILSGEETCIPYLDPAMTQSRHQILELTYGFRCDCSACLYIRSLGTLPELPTEPTELDDLGRQLREFVGIKDTLLLAPTLPSKSLESTPSSLHAVFHEAYMSSLSGTFSRCSHDGDYDIALDSGITLLALYILIYPPGYPQIGMHLLELAKTQWNAGIVLPNPSTEERSKVKEQTRVYLSLARSILQIYGPEGDDVGPLQEIKILESLLIEE